MWHILSTYNREGKAAIFKTFHDKFGLFAVLCFCTHHTTARHTTVR